VMLKWGGGGGPRTQLSLYTMECCPVLPRPGRYLQYVAARYAWSPAVHSFELFNEVDGVQTYIEQDVADWHAWALQRLAAYDPWVPRRSIVGRVCGHRP
jgi:hypothetical protein